MDNRVDGRLQAVPDFSGIKIPKRSIRVLIVWLGQRMSDQSDYNHFHWTLYSRRQFPVQTIFAFYEAGEASDWSEVEGVLIDLLGNQEEPIVIFYVVTPRAFENSNFKPFFDRISSAAKRIVAIYTIVMGGTFSEWPEERAEYFDYDETVALEKGIIYLRYSCDAPSAGSERIVEYMNRLLGMDLPGEYFPFFTLEFAQRMAWHINRENFNAIPRDDAIPKYPIVNGLPGLSFLKITTHDR